MWLQVFLTVGCQTVQAGLDGFEFLPGAEVARDVAWPGVAVPLGHVDVQVQTALLDLLSHHAEGGVGPQHGSLGEGDLALRANVYPRVVRVVPVAADAVHAETVAARNSDGVPQEVHAEGTTKVIWRCVVSHCGGHTERLRKWRENAGSKECRVESAC